VVVSFVLLLILTLVIIVSIYLCCKYKRSSKTYPNGKTGSDDTQVQPDPEYETVMECTTVTVDLGMTENAAYAPVHTLKKT
jgi:heme/copper-type cytochrome/quinol oxidase subunit 2